jgi:hypothetical protein
MNPADPRPVRRPQALAERVEDLVTRMLDGQIRVPEFQRGLNWTAEDVTKLFTSLHLGYPIGSLLFYRKLGPAAQVRIGPLAVTVLERAEAWWVVDGQQRLTALTAGLTHPLPLPTRPAANDPYVLYFDATTEKFESPPRTGEVPESWVPLPVLLDAARLSEWIHDWPRGSVERERKAAFEAGKRLREYSVPLYVIEGRDEATARQIFALVNTAGRPLKWTDVHKALFGTLGVSPSSLVDLGEELAKLGMGQLTEERLLAGLLAIRKEDPTRTLGEHVGRDPAVLAGAVEEAVPVFRRVLSFLREDLGIPHLRLLPRATLLDVLARFFSVHPDPNPRVRLLLARWFWRVVFGAGVVGALTMRRRGIQAIVDGDEERSVQNLLGLVRQDRVRPPELPGSFDPRGDDSRLTLLALAELDPCDLTTGRPLEIAALLETEGHCFARIFSESESPLARGPANRLIHEGTNVERHLVDRIRFYGANDATVSRHGIDVQAAGLLLERKKADFLVRRADYLAEKVRAFCERKCEWRYGDRPSLGYLLADEAES